MDLLNIIRYHLACSLQNEFDKIFTGISEVNVFLDVFSIEPAS